MTRHLRVWLSTLLLVSACTSQAAASPGLTWTGADLPDGFRIHSISAAGGLFFGLGLDEIDQPDPHTRLWISAEGADWEELDIDTASFGIQAGYFQDVVTVGEKYVALVKGIPITEGDRDQVVVVSSDGRSWNRVDAGDRLPTTLAGNSAGGIVLTSIYDQANSALSREVWRSTDGDHWNLAASDPFTEVSGLQPVQAIGTDLYLTARLDGHDPRLLRSSDGATWEPIDVPDLGANEPRLALPVGTQSGLILITWGAGSPRMWEQPSVGADTWSEITPEGFEDLHLIPLGAGGVTTLTGDRLSLVLGNESGSGSAVVDDIWWTTTGQQWTELSARDAFGTAGNIRAAAINQDTVVMLYAASGGRDQLWIGTLTDGA
jgi:hypothetical protein